MDSYSNEDFKFFTDEVKKSISKSNRAIAENVLDTTISAFNIPKIFDKNYKGKMATAYFIHGLVSAKVNGTLDDILSHLNNMEILKDKVPKFERQLWRKKFLMKKHLRMSLKSLIMVT